MTKTHSPSPTATRPAQPATGAATGVAECDAATLAAVGDVLFQLLWILCEATAMRTPRLLRPVVLAWMRWKLKRSVRQSMRAPVSERDLEEEYEAEEESSPKGGLRPAKAPEARGGRQAGPASRQIRQMEGNSVQVRLERVDGGRGRLARETAIVEPVCRMWPGQAQALGARGPPGGFRERSSRTAAIFHV